jgi:hypothetical protein
MSWPILSKPIQIDFLPDGYHFTEKPYLLTNETVARVVTTQPEQEGEVRICIVTLEI